MPTTKKKATPAKKEKKAEKKKSPSPKTKAPPKPVGFSPEVKIYPTPETLFQESTHLFMQISREAVDTRGKFMLALSGGSTPKGLFKQLTEEPYLSLVPWAKTYVFWVDERHVPLDNEMSNYRLAQELLLPKVPLPKDHIFPMVQSNRTVVQLASLYENKLQKLFGRHPSPVGSRLVGHGRGRPYSRPFPRSAPVERDG